MQQELDDESSTLPGEGEEVGGEQEDVEEAEEAEEEEGESGSSDDEHSPGPHSVYVCYGPRL